MLRITKPKINRKEVSKERYEAVKDKIEAATLDIQVLHANPRFHQDILDLRRKWKIPNSGFASKEEKNLWYEGLDIIHRKLLNSQNYQDKMKSLKEKHSKYIEDPIKYKLKFKDVEKMILSLEEKLARNAWKKDIQRMLVEFSLNEMWRGILIEYVLFDEWKLPYLPIVSVELIEENDKTTGELKYIYIKIFGDTTLKDIEESWGWISSIKKRLPDYKGAKKEWIYLDCDRAIYDWWAKGIKFKKISELVKERFNREVDEVHARQIVTNFKKKMRLKK